MDTHNTTVRPVADVLAAWRGLIDELEARDRLLAEQVEGDDPLVAAAAAAQRGGLHQAVLATDPAMQILAETFERTTRHTDELLVRLQATLHAYGMDGG